MSEDIPEDIEVLWKILKVSTFVLIVGLIIMVLKK